MNPDLWTRLTLENNHALINQLSRVERHEPGFSTIVIPKNGFSPDDTTHNMVIDFIAECGAVTLNTWTLIHQLERSLNPTQE
jgi:hypothetical protein